MTLAPARPAPQYALFALIGAALLLPLLVYFSTAASIVGIWQRSETFAHGFVIVPLSAWMIWRRRAELQNLPVAPFWPALLLLAVCGAAWLLGSIGGVSIVRQFALAAMLPLCVLAVLGLRIARVIAFPLLFLLLGVPFGESLIDPLIGVTADFTVDAVRASGIPVFREGNSFSLPTGNWSVVEACSGVRYLISSFTLGCLYAYLSYRSAGRRALFVLFSILVPIVANGLRAYSIVMIGHLSGMTLAVGVDHLIYGWVFFGIVMFLLFWIGSFWREDRPAAPVVAAAAPSVTWPAPARIGAMAAALAFSLALWPAYGSYLGRPAHGAQAPVELASFTPAWEPAVAPARLQPHFKGASAELHQSYQNGGQAVALDLFFYRSGPAGTELISSSNRLVAPESHKLWRQETPVTRTELLGERRLALREVLLFARSGARVLVWHWYWIDGTATASPYTGKLLQVRQKLMSKRDDGAILVVSAPFDERPEAAREAMRAFLAANLAALETTLERTRSQP
ncbi:exosortase A [Massilia sp. RP-1-19]|uniref:Exosortase A n=2 Tax=Massilia polaris TaxID=2728846 RepID=A0A848HEU3_9BURK|nr:exosortase A [Massilia polaris]